MIARLDCVGTTLRPCPAHAWWYSPERGAPRKRCHVCIDAEHNERRYLDQVVNRGHSENDARIALALHHAKLADLAGNRAEMVRLTSLASSWAALEAA